MNNWIGSFNFFMFGAGLLLCLMGLWFIVVIPGIDRWSRRFFLSFMIVSILSCLSSMLVAVLQDTVPRVVFVFLLLLEALLLSLSLPMVTVYLLHCCGEDMLPSRLFRAVLGLWAVYFGLLVSFPFIEGFFYITPENQYYRGPLYPLLLLPMIAIQLLTLMGTIKRRAQLSRKVFFAFLIAILPVAVALTAQLFVDFYPLVDISYILSALAMYSFILSDQIERDRLQQQEIVRQQTEIARQRASVMVLQMRPHFIYNTLMSIHSLCRLNPLKAEQITMDFTNYLRRNFNSVASDGVIPFSAELEHTRAYLAVEQAQYDDMIVVDYDTPNTQFRLPPLTLQPIVENAVKHGMDLDSDPLHISIRTRCTDFGAEITVEDTGPGFDPSDKSKPHTTLENIRQRLEMMCGGSMTIKPREGGGTVVTVTIPDSTERKVNFPLSRPYILQ
ncbi:MAG: histidine kinase [Lachnospiraceae bacterium]|nr:histidine kinase [Lachnospiraceae bacterium]